jgi:SAM-dependent methyltransferase
LTQEKSRYWDTVAKTWQEASPQTLWRAYNDAVNTALFGHWLPNHKVDFLLKTDLFDESLGKGLYPLLELHATRVIGMDISVLTSRSAKSRHPGLAVVGGDVRRLPFADGVFDIIVSNSTLDHFESSDEIIDSLGELLRVLKPGGQLLLTLDNLVNPVIALRSVLPFRLLNRLKIVPYFVGTTLGPNRLRDHLECLGLMVMDVSAVMHFPRILAMAMSRVLEGHSGLKVQEGFLNLLMSFERLSRWPTRFLTGYFVAVRAIKKKFAGSSFDLPGEKIG